MDAKTGSEEVEALKDDIARLRDDIASLASAVLGAASGSFDDTKAKANDKSQEARETFTGKMNEGIDRGKQFLGDIDEQVTRNPIGSVLVAFGVGILVAKILGSGNRN
jgi:ElaB/YqjD/DUF883 family membrane-anchored ribosome-binding protein